MEEKIRLELLGITGNQIEAGVYAVVLGQVGGTRRIPIIIGASEAQSIQCRLQDICPPRPLTHDLMVNMMRAYGLGLQEVILRKLPNGIFTADLLLTDGADRMITMDSRSSDAIALAVRLGSPIFTTAQVLEEAGFDPEKNDNRPQPPKRGVSKKHSKESGSISIDELLKKMNEAAESENYEEAARLKRLIDLRRDANDEK